MKFVWEYPIPGHVESIQVLDANSDGKPEVYANAFIANKNFLTALDANGFLLFNTSVETCMGWKHPDEKVNLMYVSDINGDGDIEVISGSETHVLKTDVYPVFFTGLDAERGLVRQTLIWKFLDGGETTKIRVADTDGNNSEEIVVSSSDYRIRIFDKDGTLLRERNLDNSLWDVFPENFDNDSKKELVVAAFSGVYLLDGDITLWFHDTEDRVESVYASDLNGDSVPEIVYATKHGISALTKYGKVLWEAKLSALSSNILVSDLEGDGLSEVLVGSGSSLNVFNADGSLKFSENLAHRILSLQSTYFGWGEGESILVGSDSSIVNYGLKDKYMWATLADTYERRGETLYNGGNFSSALTNAHQALGYYNKLGNLGKIVRTTSLISEIEARMSYEGRINLASEHVDKARGYYNTSDFENASYYAGEAKKIFVSLNSTSGVLLCNELLQNITDKKAANDFYNMGKEAYINGNLSQARALAKKARDLFRELGDTYNAKKAEKLMDMASQEEPSTGSGDDVAVTTYKPLIREGDKTSESKDWVKERVLLFLTLIAAYFLYRGFKSAKRQKRARIESKKHKIKI